LELIVVDDGSTDRTPDILKALTDPRLRVHRIEHSGKSSALNAGIALAAGEWVANMDADDISHPDRLATQLGLLERSRADVCGAAMQEINAAGKPGAVAPVFCDDREIKLSLRFQCPLVCGSVIVRKTLLQNVGGYAEQPVAADYDLWVRLAEYGCKFVNSPQILYFYRVHEQSLTATRSSEQASAAERSRLRAQQTLFVRPGPLRTALACSAYQVRRKQRDRWLAHNLVVFQWKDVPLLMADRRPLQATIAALAALAGASTWLLQCLLMPLRLTVAREH
jgi:glycosyltransferase involved in cell wall biosynthesis